MRSSPYCWLRGSGCGPTGLPGDFEPDSKLVVQHAEIQKLANYFSVSSAPAQQ